MELSISTSVLFDPHFPQISTEKALERLAAAGYRVLDFDFTNWLFDGSPLVGDDWEQWFESLRKRADSLAMRSVKPMDPFSTSSKIRTRPSGLQK